jgi:hypothetical protein
MTFTTHGTTMEGRNTYRNVPIEIIKRYVLNKIEGLDEVQLTRVYELISGNTCLQKAKDNCVNILVNKEHNWK